MADHLAEEEQVEAIKKWWKENGTSVIAGLVIGFSALFGWRYWVDYKDTRAGEASVLYEQTLEGLQKDEKALIAERAKALTGQYDDTAYAVLADLALARTAVEAGELDKARAALERALAQARQPGVKHVVRLRLARVMLAQGERDAAWELISDVTPGAFEAAYEELRGDLYLAAEDRTQAREAYGKALAALPQGAGYRAQLQMKFDDLTAAEAAAAATTESPS